MTKKSAPDPDMVAAIREYAKMPEHSKDALRTLCGNLTTQQQGQLPECTQLPKAITTDQSVAG